MVASVRPRFSQYARLGARRTAQHALEKCGGDAVGFVNGFAFVTRARRLRTLRLQFDARALRERAQRFGKRQVLVQLRELNDVAKRTASEAFEKTFVGMHVKRRRLLVMKRAESDQVVAAFTQLNVRADEARDIDASLNLANRSVVDRHQRIFAAPPESPPLPQNPQNINIL